MKLPIYTGSLLAAAAILLQYHPAAAANKYQPTLPLSTDSAFNFQFLIALSDAATGGSDTAPILGVAQSIKPGDMESYSENFYELANYTKSQAEDPENSYDPVNVRDTWFSASNYFRKVSFYLHRNWSNPLINSSWAEQIAAFDKALAALPAPAHRVQIPAPEGNFTVEAIWYSAAASEDRKLPTLVIGNGFDAAQEDSYHYFVPYALARGWNCITYEGPGQPTVRINQNKGYINEWEQVVTPVVDYVLSEKSHIVDQNKLVLIGNSWGGYLAARAAAFEPRLSAAVLIDGVWDTYSAYSSELPPELAAIYEAGNYTEFDNLTLSMRDAGKFPTNAAWGLDQGLWSFNTHSPSEFFTRTKQFQLQDVADRIKLPVFVGEAEYDDYFPAVQPQNVKNALGDYATLHRFNGTAGLHCQSGATQEMSRTIFAWLKKTLG